MSDGPPTQQPWAVPAHGRIQREADVISWLMKRLFGPKYTLVRRGKRFAVRRKDGKLADLYEWGFWWPQGDARIDTRCWSTRERAADRFNELIEGEVVVDWWPK